MSRPAPQIVRGKARTGTVAAVSYLRAPGFWRPHDWHYIGGGVSEDSRLFRDSGEIRRGREEGVAPGPERSREKGTGIPQRYPDGDAGNPVRLLGEYQIAVPGYSPRDRPLEAV